MTTWTLTPPWPKPPMSMNDRPHPQVRARQTAQIRSDIYKLILAAKIPPQKHVTVRLIWTVPTRLRRDAENPVPTLKAACDAMGPPTRHRGGVSPGASIVPDDTPAWMEKIMPIIEYRKGELGVRIEIEGHG